MFVMAVFINTEDILMPSQQIYILPELSFNFLISMISSAAAVFTCIY
jgi:hypothetical protein